MSPIWHLLCHSLLVGFNSTGFLRALTNLYTMGKNSSVNKEKAGSINYLQHGRTLCQRNPSFEIYFPVKAWLINMLISLVHIQSMCHIIEIWMCWCHGIETYNLSLFNGKPFQKCIYAVVWLLFCLSPAKPAAGGGLPVHFEVLVFPAGKLKQPIILFLTLISKPSKGWCSSVRTKSLSVKMFPLFSLPLSCLYV